MPQNPTDAQPIEIIKDFKGINDQQDSVSRPAGTVTDELNIIDGSTGDADRRPGRDFESLDSSGSPVSLIYDFVWNDASVFPSLIAGSSAYYNAPFSPAFNLGDIVVNPSTPGPLPNGPNYLALSKNTPFPDLTSFMRALSEARMFSNAGTDDLSWPSQSFAFDAFDGGQLIGINIRSRGDIAYNLRLGYKLRPTLAYGPIAAPTPGINIPPDFYFADIYAAGVKEVISELQTVIDNYNLVLVTYIETRPIENATTIDNYTAGDLFSASLSVATWRGVLTRLAGLINSNLLFCKNTTTLTSVQTKSGVGQNSTPATCPGDTNPAGYRIVGYFDGMFQYVNGFIPPGTLDLWNGEFTVYMPDNGTRCGYVVDTVSTGGNTGITTCNSTEVPIFGNNSPSATVKTWVIFVDSDTSFVVQISFGLANPSGFSYIKTVGGEFDGVYTFVSTFGPIPTSCTPPVYPATLTIERI